ncbi:MAG: hypothetical protein H6Q99_3642 [Proteobacteria bacterium]|nr:hypothetical protein [Pseudomonadota bacterium]
MPVVPTYDPRGVRLEPGLTFRDSTRATGEMFGAGVGAALGSVGKGMTDLGGAMADAKKAKTDQAQVDLAKAQAEAAARSGAQRASAQLNGLYYGDGNTPGYGTLTGKQAVDAHPQYRADANKVVARERESLPPAAHPQFDAVVAPVTLDIEKKGLEVLADGQKTVILGGYTAAANTYRDQAVRAPADEKLYQAFVALGLAQIEQLGFIQRRDSKTAEQARAAYISDTRKRATLALAETDPIRALTYGNDHAADLLWADKMALLDAMMPGLKAAAKRLSAHFSLANPAPDQFVAVGLPAAAYVLLGAVGEAEAPSYDAQSGGGRFGDFSKHPGAVGFGGTSTKAGRYGLDGSTWERIAAATGLGDFGPSSQDRGAWWLAKETYRIETNRSLEDDIKAGRWADIRTTLAPTWEGLAKLTDADFVKFMGVRASVSGAEQTPPRGIGSDRAASANTRLAPPIGAPVLTPTAQLPPEVEAALAGLPPALADDLRKTALAGVLEGGQDRAKADTIEQVNRAEGYQARIDSGDKTLTRRDIEEDVVLKADRKGELGAAWDVKNQESLETQRNVEKFNGGQLKFDGYGDANHAAVDRVWAEVSTWGDTSEKVRPLLNGLIRQTGMVPSQVIRDIGQGLISKDPATVLDALQMSQRLMTGWGEAVRRSKGGEVVENAASDLRVMVGQSGEEQAVKRYIEWSDPAHRPVVDEAKMNRMLKRIGPQDIVDLFGATAGQLHMGFTSMQRDQILADYTESFRVAFEETGDVDRAKARVDDKFKRIYGVTYVTGYATIMKYPAETYHGDVGGSKDWMPKRFQQLVEEVRSETKDPTIEPSEVMLEAAEGTAEAVAAGKAPIYRVFLMRRGDDGKVVRQEIGGGLLFQFDEAGAKADQARIDAAEEEKLREKQQENAQKRLEGHQDHLSLLKQAQQITLPDPYIPVTGEQGGRGNFDPDGPDTRVHTGADVFLGDASLNIWLREEEKRKALAEEEGQRARGEAAKKGNYLYVPPEDRRFSWDRRGPAMSPEEIGQERERIAGERNDRRSIGMRGMLNGGAQQIENDHQLIDNLNGKKGAAASQSSEETTSPRLWVTSYDQAETIEKEPQKDGKPQTVDTSYTRTALAALRQNSWMVSLFANQTWASDDGTIDPNFDVVEELKKLKDTKYWVYRDQALNIFNRPTFEAWKAQIDMEEEDKKVLEAAGVTGQIFGILASLVTPETFIPGGALAGGAVKGIMGASKVVPPAALVTAFEGLAEEIAKSGFQEAIFQATQETRSSSEVGKAFLSDPGRAVFIDHLSDKAKAKLLENPKTRRAVELFGDYITELVKAAAVY